MIDGVLALYLLETLELFLLASCLLYTFHVILIEQLEVLFTKCYNHFFS
jgi:hypothetical protein